MYWKLYHDLKAGTDRVWKCAQVTWRCGLWVSEWERESRIYWVCLLAAFRVSVYSACLQCFNLVHRLIADLHSILNIGFYLFCDIDSPSISCCVVSSSRALLHCRRLPFWVKTFVVWFMCNVCCSRNVRRTGKVAMSHFILSPFFLIILIFIYLALIIWPRIIGMAIYGAAILIDPERARYVHSLTLVFTVWELLCMLADCCPSTTRKGGCSATCILCPFLLIKWAHILNLSVPSLLLWNCTKKGCGVEEGDGQNGTQDPIWSDTDPLCHFGCCEHDVL